MEFIAATRAGRLATSQKRADVHTLHLVTHTHWDREWYLTFQQFRLKLVHLVDGLLDLLEADPAYRHFMLDGQTIVLEDYLLMRPERAEDLRRHVQAGRLLIGPWHILPDEFLVSGESLVRQILIGKRYFQKNFGVQLAGINPYRYLPVDDALGFMRDAGFVGFDWYVGFVLHC